MIPQTQMNLYDDMWVKFVDRFTQEHEVERPDWKKHKDSRKATEKQMVKDIKEFGDTFFEKYEIKDDNKGWSFRDEDEDRDDAVVEIFVDDEWFVEKFPQSDRPDRILPDDKQKLFDDLEKRWFALREENCFVMNKTEENIK